LPYQGKTRGQGGKATAVVLLTLQLTTLLAMPGPLSYQITPDLLHGVKQQKSPPSVGGLAYRGATV